MPNESDISGKDFCFLISSFLGGREVGWWGGGVFLITLSFKDYFTGISIFNG